MPKLIAFAGMMLIGAGIAGIVLTVMLTRQTPSELWVWPIVIGLGLTFGGVLWEVFRRG